MDSRSLLVSLTFLLMCCSVQSSKQQKQDLLLVHAAGLGSWSWFKVETILQKAGINASTINLRSAGIDTTAVHSVTNFKHYNEPLLQFLSAIPPHKKVILVGHGLGGLSVSYAMNCFPQKIEAAVFVAGTMLKRGFMTAEDRKIGIPWCRRRGVQVSNSSAHGHGIFVHKSLTRQDMTLIGLLIKPGFAPYKAISNGKFQANKSVDRIKRIYIKTLLDEALLPSQQEAMIRKWPIHAASVFSLHADHGLIFSSPLSVSQILIEVALGRSRV